MLKVPIVTIYAIWKTSSLPKTFKILLLSLAVADVGVSLLGQPLYISLLVMWLQQIDPGCNTFKGFLIVFSLFSLASFFGVVALNLDRFLAIHLHLRYRELVSHKHVVAVVIIIWVLSVFLSLMILWVPFDVSGLFVLKYISKLIEKAVAVQLNDHLALNDLHVPFQSAYRSCHSTESALMKVHNDIMMSVDNGNCVILVLLDLSAAFDTVNHDLLLSRLEKRFGIPALFLTGSSPIFVVVHNLSISINLTQRSGTYLSECHRALF